MRWVPMPAIWTCRASAPPPSRRRSRPTTSFRPENLQTVGYGERYLKIPTAEAEQENRRVSVSRATAVLGELEE